MMTQCPVKEAFKTSIKNGFQTCLLYTSLRITLSDLRQEEPRIESFHYEGGLSSFIAFLNENKEVVNPTVIDIENTKDDVVVDVALQYNDSYSENLFSFVNNINTIDGEMCIRDSIYRNSYTQEARHAII